MRIVHTSGEDPDFRLLCEELDRTLDRAIGGHDKRQKYLPHNRIETMDTVLLLYCQDRPAACAALRRYDEESAEIKRVFVSPPFRQHGFGRTLLCELIASARRMNCKRLLLETGEFLQVSIRLYQSLGFYRIPNYPPYEKMDESYCMELLLDRSSQQKAKIQY